MLGNSSADVLRYRLARVMAGVHNVYWGRGVVCTLHKYNRDKDPFISELYRIACISHTSRRPRETRKMHSRGFESQSRMLLIVRSAGSCPMKENAIRNNLRLRVEDCKNIKHYS